MYLPVILLRELGWPGLLVFAVPNVLGAAAFGYVLGGRLRSDALLARHEPAARWFSIIAIAYHAYFAAFLTTILAPAGHAPWPGLIALPTFGSLAWLRPKLPVMPLSYC